jgi:dipeptidase D
MGVLDQLKPAPVWKYFEEICTIPRASKKEDKIRAYVLEFGARHGLETRCDKGGNVLICKPASKGMEMCETVILQAHLDMVCEKNIDKIHNFDTDPIQPVIKDGWVKADGTTLGADNGVGIASMLAVLSDSDISHGPLECLFTIDEETGLTGAQLLEAGFLKGTILLNLDSEDEGELCIGCAGGVDTVASYSVKIEGSLKNHKAFKLGITGLRGGHSGDDIDKGHANSIKLITRILWDGVINDEIRIASLSGGNLRNAIAREAFSQFIIPENKVTAFQEKIKSYTEIFKKEYKGIEENLTISIEEDRLPDQIWEKDFQSKIINVLYGCPHGIIAMSRSIVGLVETSTNLASVKTDPDGKLIIGTSQRSSNSSSRKDIASQVESVFLLSGAHVTHSTGYPGWEPNPTSKVVKTAEKVYQAIFNKLPTLRAIHAGLECGLFLEKYPKLDMVSFGPTIKSPHSPDERIEIESVGKYWNFLIGLLKEIPNK